ncbi:unnamed protein product, partial [Prorocentrum cordatum]
PRKMARRASRGPSPRETRHAPERCQGVETAARRRAVLETVQSSETRHARRAAPSLGGGSGPLKRAGASHGQCRAAQPRGGGRRDAVAQGSNRPEEGEEEEEEEEEE